jgi:prolipoprotein diacylglyceryltransferase
VLASIPSPSSNGLDVGPFFVHGYGLAYDVGIAAAIWMRGGAGARRAATWPSSTT